MADRKYAMTKLAAGDFLLPGNDGRSLFRLSRVASPANTWDLYRYIGDVHRLDVNDWSNWETVSQLEPTRRAAINEAIRLSTSEED